MNLTRSAATLLAFLFLLGNLLRAEDAPPNIIYINADDLGVMDVGFNNGAYHTPHVDALKAGGMVFTDAYAPASNCAPSRACVMSGQYGARHGVYTVSNSDRGPRGQRKLIPIENTKLLPPEVLTLPQALKDGGYKTIHLGKWHVGEDPLQQGFDQNVGGSRSGGPGKGYYLPVKDGPMSPFNDEYPKGTHFADVLADQAVRFMEENKKEPFFIHMAYFLIHTPFVPVREMVGKYEERGKKKATYASMIEKMDESIGKIMAGLDEAGLRENTLVVFCSDNGAHNNVSPQDPHRSGKGSYFEGGIRVPLVARWPGKIAPGSTSEVPVCGIDFFPTFLEAAGLDTPEGKVLDGLSLLPLMTGSGEFPERTLFWHFPIYLQAYSKEDDSHDPAFRTRPGSALRSGKWKFHEYFEDGRLELYDLQADPNERNNIVDQHPELSSELHERLLQWRDEIDAPVPTKKNPKYSGE